MMYLEADERWVMRQILVTARMIEKHFCVSEDEAGRLMDKYRIHGLIDEEGNVLRGGR